MNSKFSNRYFSIMMALITLFTAQSLAQNSINTELCTITLSTSLTIISGEPLVIDIILTNKQNDPVYLYSDNTYQDLCDDKISVHARSSADENYIQLVPDIQADSFYGEPMILEKGESFRMRSIVLTGHEWSHPLIEEKSYAIKVKATVRKGNPDVDHLSEFSVESAPVSVQVQAAKGDDIKAMALWGIGMGNAVGVEACGRSYQGIKDHARLHGRAEPRESYAALDELRNQYPETIFGRYAFFFQADPWRKNYPGVLIERNERMAAFQRFVDSPTPFPLRDEAMLRLAECYLDGAGGSREDALALLDKLIREYPDSPVIPEAEEIAARINAQK